jgi:hypothetical protein
MRFYVSQPRPRFRSDVDEQNWLACANALQNFSDDEQELLMFIYQDGESILNNVNKLSAARNIKSSLLWKLINGLERNVAERRGLI